MGEASSDSDLFHSKTTPNLCSPTRSRTQVWAGERSLWWPLRGTATPPVHSWPQKRSRWDPSHSQGDAVSLPSVVGICQTTEGDKEGDSWTLAMGEGPAQGILSSSSPLDRMNLFLPSSGGEEQGILHVERQKTHFWTPTGCTFCGNLFQNYLMESSLFFFFIGIQWLENKL